MNKKFGLILIALTLLASLLLGACAATGTTAAPAATTVAPAGEATTAAPASGEKVKIRFATWDADETATFQQQLVDQYNASQDKVEVTLESYGDEYDTKISAGMGAKDAPDVMYMWNYSQYQDALEPLDGYIAKEGQAYKDNFYEALLTYNSLNGQVLGIPVGYTTHVVYYNKAIFDQAGVEYPKAGWTWDDLKSTAAKLTDPANDVVGFSFSGQPDPYDFEMYFWSNGSGYLNADKTTAGALNSDKNVEVLSMFQGMLKDKIAITTEGSGATEMKSGKVAMFINGAWSISSLKEAGIDFGVVELPQFGSQKAVSIISTSGITMYKESANKDAAWDFIKFWTNEANNKARIGYELPVLKSVAEAEKLTTDPMNGVFYNMLNQSSGYTPASYLVDDWSRLSEDLGLMFEEVFNPTTLSDPKAALDSIAE